MMQLPPLERLQYPVNYYEGGRRVFATDKHSLCRCNSSIILVEESFFSRVYNGNICFSFIWDIIALDRTVTKKN